MGFRIRGPIPVLSYWPGGFYGLGHIWASDQSQKQTKQTKPRHFISNYQSVFAVLSISFLYCVLCILAIKAMQCGQ
ncbi:hypothetical protein XENTR_v10007777 [Xenopus tropicalis]|nr:hypothetical protein XENTR_v10007777 [Xenopus tropicalis]